MAAYDPDNVFARILRGDLPCHRIYEDAHALAFLDIMPRVQGHALVIPKRAGTDLLDTDADVLADAMPALRKVARAVKAATGAQGVSIEQYNGAVAGQTVFHAHFHVLPRHEGTALKPHGAAPGDHAELALTAKKIAAAIEG